MIGITQEQYHRHTGIGSDGPKIRYSDLQDTPAAAITKYDVTASNVENTATETEIISFTIPANTISDGDVIKVHFVSLFQWDDTDGSATNTLTIKAKVAGTSVTLHTSSESDDATEYAYMAEITFQRVGSNLYVNSNPGAETPFVSPPQSMLLKPGALNTSNTQLYSGFDHTIDNEFTITVDFSATGDVYWRVQSAKAYKI